MSKTAIEGTHTEQDEQFRQMMEQCIGPGGPPEQTKEAFLNQFVTNVSLYQPLGSEQQAKEMAVIGETALAKGSSAAEGVDTKEVAAFRKELVEGQRKEERAGRDAAGRGSHHEDRDSSQPEEVCLAPEVKCGAIHNYIGQQGSSPNDNDDGDDGEEEVVVRDETGGTAAATPSTEAGSAKDKPASKPIVFKRPVETLFDNYIDDVDDLEVVPYEEVEQEAGSNDRAFPALNNEAETPPTGMSAQKSHQTSTFPVLDENKAEEEHRNHEVGDGVILTDADHLASYRLLHDPTCGSGSLAVSSPGVRRQASEAQNAADEFKNQLGEKSGGLVHPNRRGEGGAVETSTEADLQQQQQHKYLDEFEEASATYLREKAEAIAKGEMEADETWEEGIEPFALDNDFDYDAVKAGISRKQRPEDVRAELEAELRRGSGAKS